MRDINIDLNNLDANLYYTSTMREGEHNASQLVITLSEEFVGYTYKLSFKLNAESTYLTNDLVPVDGVITYLVTNALTSEYGTLKCELQAYDDDIYLAKSAIFPLRIQSALEGIPIEMPSDYVTYIQVVNHYMDKDIYDPQGINGDAFSMGNMTETSTAKIMTNAERQKLAILGGGQSIVEYIDFDTTPTSDPHTLGRVQWNNTKKTIDVGVVGTEVAMQVGQDLIIYAKNNTGSTLGIGKVVSLAGVSSGNPSIVLADANGTAIEKNVVGIVGGKSILNGESGFVVINGLISNIDTSAFNEGDMLYLSTVKGVITNVIPSLPTPTIQVGYCIKKDIAPNGQIYVKLSKVEIANEIKVIDSANYFVGINVEDVLQEIGLNLKLVYGDLYLYNNSTPQTIPVSTSYTKLSQFMAKGEEVNCTIDAPNNQIIITNTATYRVSMSFSSSINAGVLLETALFKNGVEVTKLHIARDVASNITSVGTINGLLNCNSGDILDVRVRHDKSSGTANITTKFGNFNIEKVS